MDKPREITASDAGVVLFLFAVLAVPMVGAVMFMKTDNSGWLTLMVPLFVFMEGAFVLGPVMLLIACVLVGYGVV